MGSFEWDDAKNRSNVLKHSISFDDARRVFDDPAAVEQDVSREREGEARWGMVGQLDGAIIYVCFTRRPGGVQRIISARKASRHERRRYHESDSER